MKPIFRKAALAGARRMFEVRRDSILGPGPKGMTVEAGFDVLLTTDKNIRYQQNLEGRKIAVVVIGQQQWPRLRLHVHLVTEAVNAAKSGTCVEVNIPL